MSDQPSDDRLRDLLRSRDPAAQLSPAHPELVAGLLEDAMSHDDDIATHDSSSSKADPRRRTPLTWLVAAAALLVIAGVGAFAIFGGDAEPVLQADDSAPHVTDQAITVTELTAGAPLRGRCAMVTAERLAPQETAFEGTVTAIDDTAVTLEVERWYRGHESDVVQVKGPPENWHALIQAVTFEEGKRYLVSATDGSVSLCGFSAEYSDELAALYAQAFAS